MAFATCIGTAKASPMNDGLRVVATAVRLGDVENISAVDEVLGVKSVDHQLRSVSGKRVWIAEARTSYLSPADFPRVSLVVLDKPES